jgi:hypothetical protein
MQESHAKVAATRVLESPSLRKILRDGVSGQQADDDEQEF